MNTGFKQRLVGAVVLLCLALILWPLIFSNDDPIMLDRSSQIPETPEFEKYTVAAPTRPDNIEPVMQPQPDPVPAKAVSAEPEVTKARAKPTLDNRKLPEAWVLQVASFSKAANASRLKKKLLAKGYKAYTRDIKTSDGVSTRVYIGPRLTQDAFDKVRPTINKEHAVNAVVVRYEQ